MVFSIAYRFLHDRGVAEELAQDVFLQLYRELPRIDSAEHVKFWLRKVISHRAIDHARRTQRHPQVALEDAPEPAVSQNGSDPLLDAALRKLVASLPEQPRMIVVLRYQEDMEPQEIADVLGMPVATVKSHLQRGLALLREKAQRTIGEAMR
jgi:RNA polymerase sigma-70 factor (ECF subfamily)